MADKKECDRCKTLAAMGELRDWARVSVVGLDGKRIEGVELCGACTATMLYCLSPRSITDGK